MSFHSLAEIVSILVKIAFPSRFVSLVPQGTWMYRREPAQYVRIRHSPMIHPDSVRSVHFQFPIVIYVSRVVNALSVLSTTISSTPHASVMIFASASSIFMLISCYRLARNVSLPVRIV